MDRNDDLRKRFEDLVSQSFSDRARNTRDLNDALGTLRGPGDHIEFLTRIKSFIDRHVAEYGEDLARIGLEMFRSVLELNQRYNESFFAEVFHQHRGLDPRGETLRRPVAQVEVDLEAAPDAISVSRSFVVENRYDTPAQISFLVSEFSEVDGNRCVRLPLEFAPAVFELRSQEERIVRMSCPVNRELLEPGRSYLASVIVRGHEDLELRLRLTLLRDGSGHGEGSHQESV